MPPMSSRRSSNIGSSNSLALSQATFQSMSPEQQDVIQRTVQRSLANTSPVGGIRATTSGASPVGLTSSQQLHPITPDQSAMRAYEYNPHTGLDYDELDMEPASNAIHQENYYTERGSSMMGTRPPSIHYQRDTELGEPATTTSPESRKTTDSLWQPSPNNRGDSPVTSMMSPTMRRQPSYPLGFPSSVTSESPSPQYEQQATTMMSQLYSVSTTPSPEQDSRHRLWQLQAQHSSSNGFPSSVVSHNSSTWRNELSNVNSSMEYEIEMTTPPPTPTDCAKTTTPGSTPSATIPHHDELEEPSTHPSDESIDSTKPAKMGAYWHLILASFLGGLGVGTLIWYFAIRSNGAALDPLPLVVVSPNTTNPPETVRPSSVDPEGPAIHDIPVVVVSAEAHVLSLLPATTLEVIATHPYSPQALAFGFVVKDPLLVLVDQSDNGTHMFRYPDWRILQRFALACFYYATDGPTHWTQTEGWVTYSGDARNECYWFSSSVNGLGVGQTDMCASSESGDNEGRITKLHLWNNGLYGESGVALPEELYLLTDLESIILAGNNLQGPMVWTPLSAVGTTEDETVVPVTSHLGIHRLSKLTTLHLESNDIFGPIPTEIGALTNLKHLDLSDNVSMICFVGFVSFLFC